MAFVCCQPEQANVTNAGLKSTVPAAGVATSPSDDGAWKLAVMALNVAATFSPDGSVDDAEAIVRAARDVAPAANLHLYVVGRVDDAHSGTRKPAVMTAQTMRRRWPSLFKHGGPGTAEGAEVWSHILDQPVASGRVVTRRLFVDQSVLDAEFGPRQDPIVERVRALVASRVPRHNTAYAPSPSL
ncbi:hypothetical protein pkur_cds_751 [Pandoravirus kuranda]|uniref:Uncharacterized protein n=1 Tax=Pandoravirus kuranda TaxID=3019033 RepID=A0AA95J6Y9_9VIRU|nr:hypothetical protein pkur_cds_751 [Pandoravirus kuranda]